MGRHDDGRAHAEAFLREEPAAVATVRDWVEAMVRGGWRLPDHEAAVQEIMLELTQLMRRGRIPETDRFRSYVVTVARHTCIDIHRREALRATEELPPELPSSRIADDPEAALVARRKLRIARSILQSLTEDCRRLLSLVYGEGLKAKEVGERLGLSAGNVRVRTHRCLTAARAMREEWWPELKTTQAAAGNPFDGPGDEGAVP